MAWNRKYSLLLSKIAVLLFIGIGAMIDFNPLFTQPTTLFFGAAAQLGIFVAMLLAGRVAESLMIGDISTGASNDLQRATELARKMVVEFGMSDNIGPIFLGNDTEIFIGKDFGHQRNYSEDVAMKVDREIREILEKAYMRAKNILEEGKEGLERVKAALLEHERLDGEEFAAYYEGREVPVKDADSGDNKDDSGDKAFEAPDSEKGSEDAGKGENFDFTV